MPAGPTCIQFSARVSFSKTFFGFLKGIFVFFYLFNNKRKDFDVWLAFKGVEAVEKLKLSQFG